MNIKTYKIFLTLSWVTALVGVAVDVMSENTLPAKLEEDLEASYNAPFTISEIILIAIGIPLLISLIISYVGLYRFKPWSRKLFLITIALFYPLSFVDLSPFIYTVWADDLYSLSYIFTGIFIAGMYYVPEIRNKYMKQPDA
jgi:hypothetical protein